MPEFVYLLLVFALTVAAALALFNSFVIPRRCTVKTKKPCPQLKIALVSDFHNNRHLAPSLLRCVRAFSPDIILIAGDFVDRRKPDYQTAKKVLSALRGIADTYYVTGNHEAGLGRETVAAALDCGDILLDGAYKIFNGYALLGIADQDTGDDREDTLALFSRLDTFKIAVVHRPGEYFRELKIGDLPVDLTVCGHYHGGLVRIPFFGAIAVPDEGFFPKLAKGVFHADGKTLVVSGGAGNTIAPLRLNNFPEVVCVTVEETK